MSKSYVTRGGKRVFLEDQRTTSTPTFGLFAQVPDAPFNGPDYDSDVDHKRLRGQILRVFELMSDGEWRTLAEIEARTGDPQASVSAQLRHLRKPRFGEHDVRKRRRGDDTAGLWEYRIDRAAEEAA